MYEKVIRNLKIMEREHRKEFGGATEESVVLHEAADAIEELNKRIDFLMNCIYEAEDALDRGADNEWARASLEKAERGAERCMRNW